MVRFCLWPTKKEKKMSALQKSRNILASFFNNSLLKWEPFLFKVHKNAKLNKNAKKWNGGKKVEAEDQDLEPIKCQNELFLGSESSRWRSRMKKNYWLNLLRRSHESQERWHSKSSIFKMKTKIWKVNESSPEIHSFKKKQKWKMMR